MQIPDFRQYSQTGMRKISGRNILVWSPRRSDFTAQKADAEHAKILYLLMKNASDGARSDSGETKSET
ncbi:MAG: hypothetical protein IKH27_01310 [Oscillospiraceae bacterium]|nr:hypothetical protein [Oscillospiraceae bacterium]